MNKQIVPVSQTALSVFAAAAVQAFAETGRTVAITRYGDAPIEPITENNWIIKTATTKEIEDLCKHKELRTRFQILESVPYTDIIIAKELPKPSRVKLFLKEAGYVLSDSLGLLGDVLTVLLSISGKVLLLTIFLPFAILGYAAGVDPIVYARLPSGEWLEVCRFYD